jgi:OmcA/MtrC family decaheme c-type cytochrome
LRVLVVHNTDYVVPATYPPPFDDTPDLGESAGEWTGKAVVPGTYTLYMWGVRPLQFSVAGQATDYRGTAAADAFDFTLGAPAAGSPWVGPYSAITSGANCYRCHGDIYFHGGGRRGFEGCLACHGQATLEDRPPFTTGSLATPGLSAAFRDMIHKIHMGGDLPDAATYPWEPEGHFPAMPGAAKHCTTCHGATNENWKSPPDRTHPDGQTTATGSWRVACGACHSATAALAHMDVNTAPSTGAESCAVCHGGTKEWPVEKRHMNR